MRPEKDSRDLFKGALILTIAALITKVLSAMYRVPFQNIVGDVGFYIYQQVYPFYGAALVLATSGFPVIISKLHAEQAVKKGRSGVHHLFAISAFILMLIGLSGFSILYWGAEWLAALMGDPGLARLLRIISVVFLIFPIVSVLRGYFQGTGNMVPTAVSQVGEQFVRVLTILLTAWILTTKGYSLYIVGSGAVLGSVTGGITAILLLGAFYWNRRRRALFSIEKMDWIESRKIASALIFQGLAVCISSMLLVFIQMADSLNLYSILLSSGFTSEGAKELKGIYDRGQPLIQLGTVVATSMSLTLVPMITSENLKEQMRYMHDKIRLALQIGLFVGVGATFGLWSIIKPTNQMLFENNEGSEVLAVLCLLILFMSIIITTTAILQGLGNFLFPACVILCGFGMKYGLNMIFVPLFDTMGAAFASCLTLGMVMVLLLYRLRVLLKTSILSIRFSFVVGAAALVMVIVLKIYIYVTGLFPAFNHDRLFASFQSVSAVIVGAAVYLWIVLKGSTFKEEELAMLPFGSKLLFFLPKKK
ncbi:oligosaccharide flippase family protein [Cytobacillus praedii]|uniref:putative polysaccharide biosynthesis protein n=1 Tax=Cytobacillus praedii TaxID=1742358 RepID=UPI002E2250AD|nr:oligosaccharide flippase family protein [Cytobacillus praedii]MED3554160.1 oligosaccharide flippase family protein [Cytobacillus praedii]